jgi:large subunit ribosomal protein L14
MIQKESRLKIIDNSGAKEVLMIGATGYSKRKSFDVGDIIKVTVKDALPQSTTSKSKVKKGEIYFALIVKSKYPIRRKTGHMISFDENAAILLTPQLVPIGTSIFGDVPREITRSNIDSLKKITSMVTGGVL